MHGHEQARHEGTVSELSVLERQGVWVPLDEQVGHGISHGSGLSRSEWQPPLPQG